jgi:F-type H+-transporting ATPase subunit b
MQIDWWTLGLQTLNAVVLIWLLAHFLFRPVADAIAGRQKLANQLLADAKAAKAAAQSEQDKALAEAAELAAHRSDALKAIEAEAAAAKSTLLAKAQAEVDKLRAAFAAEIETQRRTEALAAEDRAGELAIDIVNKLLDRLAREVRVSAFIDGIAAGLAQLPNETRASVGAEGRSVHVTTARAPTSAEVEACRKSLEKVLGHSIALDVSVDPKLIAGIELEAPYAVVRNSFRADLARLKSELVHHDRDLAYHS